MSIIYWNIWLLSQFSLTVCRALFKNQSTSPCAELPEVGIHCLNSESIYLFSTSYQLFIFPLKWKSTIWAEKDHWLSENNSAWVFHSPLQRDACYSSWSFAKLPPGGSHVSDQTDDNVLTVLQRTHPALRLPHCNSLTSSAVWIFLLFMYSPLWGKQALESQLTAYQVRVYSSVEIPPLNPRT